MKRTDAIIRELPLIETLYQKLDPHQGRLVQDLPDELMRSLRKLTLIPPLTASGLEKVYALRLLLAAAYVVGEERLKGTNKPTRPLPKR